MDNSAKKYTISSKTLAQLEEFVVSLDEPKFRAKQLHSWVYTKFAKDFDEMSNLSKSLKEKLKECAVLSNVKIKQKLTSSDGTIKYLMEFEDGKSAEAVLMRFDNRPNLTACVSSQIGCPVGCAFCATGQNGFVRNLSAEEITEQIMTIQRDTKLRITNVVFMGQGEPLLNIENVLEALNLINDEVGIGIRRMTVSTSGVIPGIQRMEKENVQVTMALSLHAPTHELRKTLIPIEEKYNVKDVIEAMKNLVNTTKRRATIEYTMIKGLNDTPEHAKQFIELIKGLHCNINLIPYNDTCGGKFGKSDEDTINKFKFILERSPHKVTVRLERGADIMAACGQLTGKENL